jgi:uncharacterized protein YdaU (DUF1376 family)
VPVRASCGEVGFRPFSRFVCGSDELHRTGRFARGLRFFFLGFSPELRRPLTDAPWFPLYVKDWLVATRRLTAEQRGLYMDLLCFAWEDGGLPLDVEAMRRLTQSTTAVWKRAWPDLAGKFEVRDGRWVNRRMERVRDEMLRMVEKKSKAGKAGAARRWQAHASAMPVPLADTMANDSYSHSYPHSHPQPHNSSLTLAVVARAPAPGSFDLSPGQLQAAAPGLIGAWNNLAASDGQPFKDVTVRSHPKVTAALRAHADIDWWGDLFRRVVVSDRLNGRHVYPDGGTFTADLFWVLDKCEEIAAGRYDNREAVGVRDANADAVAAAKRLLR